MRFILFTAIVFGVFYFFYSKLRRFLAQIFQPPDGGSEQTENTSTKPGRINKGEMRQCPSCGVYFPVGTGTKSGGTEYCSDSCAKKGNHK